MFNSKLLHWLVYCNDDRTGRDTRTQPFIVKDTEVSMFSIYIYENLIEASLTLLQSNLYNLFSLVLLLSTQLKLKLHDCKSSVAVIGSFQ